MNAKNFEKSTDHWSRPFRTLVLLGESTVQGGGWLTSEEDRYADVLVRLINDCQEEPVAYHNRGIGANVVSPRSPGYEDSARPSALERYRTDVIDLRPDLFVLAYGLNDMRAGMEVSAFREDMATILRDVRQACAPLTVLTTVYYMTGWRGYPPFDRGTIESALAYNEAIRSLAVEYDCVLADVWSAEGGADWLLHYDGIHANRVGNLVIAHRIFEAIAQQASGLTIQDFKEQESTAWTRETLARREESGDPFRKTW